MSRFAQEIIKNINEDRRESRLSAEEDIAVREGTRREQLEEYVKEREGKGEDELNGKDMGLWMNCGTRFEYPPAEYCTPRLNFKGKGIDSFKTKKEAWDSLEMELKQRVRSCVSGEWFCGTCNKCLAAKKYKLRDLQGNPL